MECICSNSTTLSGVRSSHLMVLNEHQTYVMCHQLFEEVVWICSRWISCTLHLARGAAPGKGLTGKGLHLARGLQLARACQKKKRKLVSPLPVAITTLAPVALCTGDDVCNTCDARAELVQAGLLACLAGSLASPRKKCPRKKSSRWHKTQTLPSLKHNFCTVKKLVQYTCLHLPFHSCSLVKRSITKHSVKRQKTEILKSESVLKM